MNNPLAAKPKPAAATAAPTTNSTDITKPPGLAAKKADSNLTEESKSEEAITEESKAVGGSEGAAAEEGAD